MTNCIATTPQSNGILDKPIFYPIKFALTPLLWLVHKVVRAYQIVIGYLVTLGVFSNGKFNRSWFNRALIGIYKGGCYDTHERAGFDPSRLNNAFKVLEDAGGIRTETVTRDGHVLDSMLIRYKDVKEQIEAHGGRHISSFPIKGEIVTNKGKEVHLTCDEFKESNGAFIDVILPDLKKPDAGWEAFSKETLSKLGLETVTIKLENGSEVEGFVTKHWTEKDPIRPDEGLCFVRSNAPTENFPMGKRDIMRRVLGLHADEFCFDYRGSGISHGNPTEGGYYLDIEAAIEKIRDFYGYDLKRTVIDGFCLGGGVAMHAKQRFHEEGINLFTQNTFCCLKHTLHQQVFPANHLAHHGHTGVHSRDPLIHALLGKYDEDTFDNVGKLSFLRSKMGISIILNTDTDTTIDNKSHTRLVEAAEKVSEKCFHILYKGEPGKNGHSFDVLSDRKTWDRIYTYLTAIDHPEILGRG